VFSIRRIHDCTLPHDRGALGQVQEILRAQFPLLSDDEVNSIPDKLRNPLKHRFRTVLFVAEDGRGTVKGFALLLHAPDLEFSYLDFISAAERRTGGGIGSALYETVRREARDLGALAVVFECLPDDPALCRDPAVLRQNADRLRFYERYGARPLAGTAYETPLKPGGDCPPYLVIDGLGRSAPLRRAKARAIVRAVLERKYGDVCPPGYVEMVVSSIQDDPVRLREPRYAGREEPVPVARVRSLDQAIALLVNDRHRIHHMRERGYVESPVRVEAILREIVKTDLFHRLEPRHHSESHIRAVHDGQFVDFLTRRDPPRTCRCGRGTTASTRSRPLTRTRTSRPVGRSTAL
jgi:GNAT superfamily N-acetyltransferase